MALALLTKSRWLYRFMLVVFEAGLFLCALGAIKAEDTLTATLVSAMQEKRNRSDRSIGPFDKDILATFGYTNLKIIGRKSRPIQEQSQGILRPNHSIFYAHYKVVHRLAAHYQLRLDLLQALGEQEKRLASIEVLLAKGGPLYVLVPSSQNKALIFILEIDKE